MKQITKFYPIILLGLFLLLIGLIIFYTYFLQHRLNPQSSRINIETGILREVNVNPGQFGEGYKEIIPGLSTKKEAIFKLGSKYERETKDGYEYLTYKYDPTHTFGDVFVSINEKGIVEKLNHEAILKPNGTDVNYWLQKYGEPEVLTFSSWDQGVREYAYPSRGVWLRVYQAKTILTWFYFQPVSSKGFLETIGKEFPLEDPFIK